MAQLFQAYNAPAPTTSGIVKVTTGSSLKTLLQLKSIANSPFKIVEWGVSFDGSTAATPILCELIETDVAATVTAPVNAGIPNIGDPGGPTPDTYLSLGTAASGYTASAEGTITATRMYDAQLVAPTNQYVKQWPLGREPQYT